MIKRSLFSIAVLITVFICLISIVCPAQSVAEFIPDGQAVKKYFPNEIVSFSGATISNDGRVNIIGENPNIYLGGINHKVKTVAIELEEPFSQSFDALMYYDTGKGLNEGEKVYSSAFAGDKWIFFVISEDVYCTGARIDIDIEYKLKSVNLYETEPKVLKSKLVNPWWEYLVCAVVSIVLAAFVFLIDVKFNFLDKIWNYLKKHKKSILIVVIGFAISILISACIELLCGHKFGVSSNGETFNIYRYLLICGITLSAAAVLYFVRCVDKSPEKLLLAILLISGTVMIFGSPFGHISWDAETHYKRALDASYVGDSYKTQADRYVISNQDLYWSKETALDNENNIERVNESDDYIVEEFNTKKSLAHMPSGLFIALARFFKLNFYWVYNLGIMPNLLIYAFACYFGMKKLKSGKMIFAVVALLPTNLFIATNYSYDYWVNALSMLGIAYFVSEMQQPDKQITLKDNIIMCGALALASVPKQIYATLLLIPFFLRKNEFKNRKRYYIVCISAFVMLFLMLAVRSLTMVSSAGDLRGGSAVNPSQQIEFILGQPLVYAKTLFEFLKSYLSLGSTREYISNLAYIGYGQWHYVVLLLMIFTALTDKNEYDLNNKYLLLKSFNLLLFVGMAALMATALYIDFTPVGSNYISGCQGRYLAPLLLPVLLVVGNGFIKNTANRKVYNCLIISCCSIILFATIYSTMTLRLM